MECKPFLIPAGKKIVPSPSSQQLLLLIWPNRVRWDAKLLSYYHLMHLSTVSLLNETICIRRKFETNT
jgi:hypothetical protein